jgi:antitoxin component YwqK of YwqJK toxin-antitoxin module
VNIRIIHFSLLLIFLFSSCEKGNEGKGTVASVDQLETEWVNLQLRNGVVYLPNSEIPFSGVSKSIYQNGQKYLLAKFESGILANFKLWTQNGIPQIEGDFTQGELSDLGKLFDPELREFGLPSLSMGRTTEGIYFRKHFGLSENCLRNGTWRFWYPNGEKMKEFSYKDGILDGSFSKWNEDGQLLTQQHYSLGKWNGTWLQFYHPPGHLKEERHYEDGKPVGIWSKWASSGLMTEKCFYSDGMKNGISMRWHENGQLASKAIYEDGGLNGLLQEFSPSGQQLLSAGYKHGIKWGLEKKWYENGSQGSKIFWNNRGRKHGKIEAWFNNGNRKTVRHYDNGNLLEAQSWRPDGKLNPDVVQHGNGKLIYYDVNGKITHTQFFQEGEQVGN